MINLLFINILNMAMFYKNYDGIEIEFYNIIDNINFKFSIESLGIIFALVSSFLWIITFIYAHGYLLAQNIRIENSNINESINKDLHSDMFFPLTSLSMACVIAISFAGNLVTLFIFYELLTIFTYPLIAGSGTAHAIKSSTRYFIMMLGTSISLFLPAIIITNSFANTTDFQIGGILNQNISVYIIMILLFCFVYGIGKAALIPMHSWLPSAMVAPAPVSALFHAVAVVKAGIFCIIKIIIYIFGIDLFASLARINFISHDLLVFISCLSVILASIFAFRQNSIKKMLAYSTISHLSYCIMATSIMTKKAIIAAIMHMIVHSFSKITLFFVAGNIYTSTHKTEIDQIKGLGKLMPGNMLCFFICALFLIDIPQMAGFFSKYSILSACLDYKYYYIIFGTKILSSFIAICYFIPPVYSAYFKDSSESNIIYIQPSLLLNIPMAITTIITIFMYVIIDFISKTINLISF